MKRSREESDKPEEYENGKEHTYVKRQKLSDPPVDLCKWYQWKTEEVISYLSWLLRRDLSAEEKATINRERIIGMNLRNAVFREVFADPAKKKSDGILVYLGIKSFGERNLIAEHISRLIRVFDKEARQIEELPYKVSEEKSQSVTKTICETKGAVLGMSEKIWKKIFFYTICNSIKTVYSLSLVCSHFNNMLRDPVIWYNLCHTNYGCQCNNFLLEKSWIDHCRYIILTRTRACPSDILSEPSLVSPHNSKRRKETAEAACKSQIIHGYDVEMLSFRQQDSTLSEAVKQRYPVDFIEWLIVHAKADVNTACMSGSYNTRGTNPLDIALTNSNEKLVRLLLKHGACVSKDSFRTVLNGNNHVMTNLLLDAIKENLKQNPISDEKKKMDENKMDIDTAFAPDFQGYLGGNSFGNSNNEKSDWRFVKDMVNRKVLSDKSETWNEIETKLNSLVGWMFAGEEEESQGRRRSRSPSPRRGW